MRLRRCPSEEFDVVLPDATAEQAAQIAERLRASTTTVRMPGLAEPVSASFGIAMRRHGESRDETLQRADRALYRAKSAGRDRVVAA